MFYECRINFFLRLIVEFMDIYSVKDYEEEIKLLKRPKFMSIAAVIELIWQRLKLHSDTTIIKKVQESKNNFPFNIK